MSHQSDNKFITLPVEECTVRQALKHGDWHDWTVNEVADFLVTSKSNIYQQIFHIYDEGVNVDIIKWARQKRKE